MAVQDLAAVQDLGDGQSRSLDEDLLLRRQGHVGRGFVFVHGNGVAVDRRQDHGVHVPVGRIGGVPHIGILRVCHQTMQVLAINQIGPFPIIHTDPAPGVRGIDKGRVGVP